MLEILGGRIEARCVHHAHSLPRVVGAQKRPANKALCRAPLWYSLGMLALEHLHANALFVVLLVAALALFTLRAAVYLCQRALVARDRATLHALVDSAPSASRTHDDAQS